MTNLEYIRSSSEEELAAFLDDIAYGSAPWSEKFSEAFCKSCPTETVRAEGYAKPLELCECDFVDGKCPHGDSLHSIAYSGRSIETMIAFVHSLDASSFALAGKGGRHA